jgi:hypothetical protein
MRGRQRYEREKERKETPARLPAAHSRLTVPHGGEQLAGRLIMKRRRRHHGHALCTATCIDNAIATTRHGTRHGHRHVDADAHTHKHMAATLPP